MRQLQTLEAVGPVKSLLLLLKLRKIGLSLERV